MPGEYSYDAWRLKNKIKHDKQVAAIMNSEHDPYTNQKNPEVDGLKIGPDTECSYEEALEKGICFYCHQPLKWELNIPGGVTGSDDRCCFARCCGKLFAMIPKVVRIVVETEKLPWVATEAGLFGKEPLPPLDDDNYGALDRGYYDMGGYNNPASRTLLDAMEDYQTKRADKLYQESSKRMDDYLQQEKKMKADLQKFMDEFLDNNEECNKK